MNINKIVFMTGVVSFFLVFMGYLEVMGEEFFTIDKETVIASDGPGKYLRSSPSVAFGNNIFLVVWQEGWHGDGGSSRIYASRVNQKGEVIDPEGFEVSACKTGIQENAKVVFGHGLFFVVWQDLRNGKDLDIYGARITPDGQVLDDPSIPLAILPRTQAMPGVASDEKGFLVVWHGFKGQQTTANVFARRVRKNGEMGKPRSVIPGARPVIAWNGKEHLLVYSTARQTTPNLAGQSKCWLRIDTEAKPLSKAECNWKNENYALCAMPLENKGWVMANSGKPPNFWGRTNGVQRVVEITKEGKRLAPSDDTDYDPTHTVPGNWLDTSWRTSAQKTADKKSKNKIRIWPWGGSTLATAGEFCVAAWQRYKIGGATGISLFNSDISIGRVAGWRREDQLGGIELANSSASEVKPALAGDESGSLLCVYEKRLKNGKRLICSKSIRVLF